MTEKETTRPSKFLSLILRHQPEQAGLKLDAAGWIDVQELLSAVNQHGVPLTLDQFPNQLE
jgi:putative RNA 2'-phosphotransferase